MRNLAPEELGLVSGGQTFNIVITATSTSNGGAGEHNTQGNVAAQSGGNSGVGNIGGSGGTGLGINLQLNDNS